jgi:uncharacterized LabA/DUF88 family protein
MVECKSYNEGWEATRSMSNFLYVDNSNVWIEGMHVSAVTTGNAPDIWSAIHHRICDYGWKMDFGKLYEFAGGQASEVGRAVLYGSRPPANDSLWAIAERKGFEVIVHDRNVANKEKQVDTHIATDMVSDSYELMKPGEDEITLVAGDADYVPTIEKLRARGFTVHVVFWAHASRELQDTASKFIPLNPYLDFLCLK